MLNFPCQYSNKINLTIKQYQKAAFDEQNKSLNKKYVTEERKKKLSAEVNNKTRD